VWLYVPTATNGSENPLLSPIKRSVPFIKLIFNDPGKKGNTPVSVFLCSIPAPAKTNLIASSNA